MNLHEHQKKAVQDSNEFQMRRRVVMREAGFEKVGVIGAGQMGAGIAQVCATLGLSVTLVDTSAAQIERARKSIETSIRKLAEKGTVPADRVDVVERTLRYGTRWEDMGMADLAIEAVTEDEGLKCRLFRWLDEALPPVAILASNTSSIPISRLAGATCRPGQVIGMHFMNPVPLMPLVEVVPGLTTTEETRARIVSLARAMGKTVTMSTDSPGFVTNRVLMPMINEAFFALMEGVASAEDIDTAMTQGIRFNMGPLALADFIGLDTCLSIMRTLHEHLGDSKYRPCPLLARYVDAGLLGRKTGRGVFTY